MKGLRTIAANVVGAFIVPKLVAGLKAVGIDLTPQEQLELTAQVFAVGNLVLRKYTTTPIGVATAAAVPALDQIKQLVPALYALLAKHQQERNKAKETL